MVPPYPLSEIPCSVPLRVAPRPLACGRETETKGGAPPSRPPAPRPPPARPAPPPPRRRDRSGSERAGVGLARLGAGRGRPSPPRPRVASRRGSQAFRLARPSARDGALRPLPPSTVAGAVPARRGRRQRRRPPLTIGLPRARERALVLRLFSARGGGSFVLSRNPRVYDSHPPPFPGDYGPGASSQIPRASRLR